MWYSVYVFLTLIPLNHLKQEITTRARQLGFILAGVTTPDPPPHYSTFENWLAQGHHGTMDYLANERSRARRADPREILPECKSILVLATPYTPPTSRQSSRNVAKRLRVEEESQAKLPPTPGAMTITMSSLRG